MDALGFCHCSRQRTRLGLRMNVFPSCRSRIQDSSHLASRRHVLPVPGGGICERRRSRLELHCAGQHSQHRCMVVSPSLLSEHLTDVHIDQVATQSTGNTTFSFQWTPATNFEVGASVVGYEVTILYVPCDHCAMPHLAQLQQSAQCSVVCRLALCCSVPQLPFHRGDASCLPGCDAVCGDGV